MHLIEQRLYLDGFRIGNTVTAQVDYPDALRTIVAGLMEHRRTALTIAKDHRTGDRYVITNYQLYSEETPVA